MRGASSLYACSLRMTAGGDIVIVLTLTVNMQLYCKVSVARLARVFYVFNTSVPVKERASAPAQSTV